jgi:hypothetical protein
MLSQPVEDRAGPVRRGENDYGARRETGGLDLRG